MFSELSETPSLVNPSRYQSMHNISKIFHKHMSISSNQIPKSDCTLEYNCFHVNNFLPPSFRYFLPIIPQTSPFVNFQQYQVKHRYVVPTIGEIRSFISSICDKLSLSTECVIIALIYIEKLMNKCGISLLPENWRTIVIVGLLTASKVWNDESAWNVEFSEIFSILSLDTINLLEHRFLEGLKFDLYISASTYAKYYFALRELGGNTSGGGRNIPQYYLKLNLLGSRRIQEKTINRQTTLPGFEQMAMSV